MEWINELLKTLLDKEPFALLAGIFIVFLIVMIIATRATSKQNSEDHKEKELLIELVKTSTTAFNELTGAINELKDAQKERNEKFEIQITEQKTTNQNLQSLNIAFADYHTSLADTIAVIFKNQITGRLDKLENAVEKILDIVVNKPDCNDEILNRLNDLGRDVNELKIFATKQGEINRNANT